MSGKVSYYLELIDQFSKQAAEIQARMGALSKASGLMGRAFDAAEKALNAIRPTAGLAGVAKQMGSATTAADMFAKRHGQAAGTYIQASHAIEARNRAEASSAARAAETAAAANRKVGTSWTDLYVKYQFAKGAVRGAYGILGKGDSLTQLQDKMSSSGVTNAAIRDATDAAFAASQKYQNVSQAEALHMAGDLRAVMGSQEAATEHLGTAVKYLQFLKQYEGGRHQGKETAAYGEIYAAIKSGELAGKFTDADVDKNLGWLVAAKTVYGDGLNIRTMLTAQRNSLAAGMTVNDQYRYGVQTALVQALGVKAGVAFNTWSNKLVAGVNWRKAGVAELVNLGLLEKGQAPGENKLARLAAVSPDAAVMQLQSAIMDKYGTVGADGKKSLDPITLRQELTKIFGTANAAAFPQEILQNWARIAKDLVMIETAHRQQQRDMAIYDSDPMQKKGNVLSVRQRRLWRENLGAQVSQFSKQFDTILGNLTQGTSKTLAGHLYNLNAGPMKQLSAWVKANPEWAKTFTMVAGGLALAAASVTALRTLGAMRGLAGLGAGGLGMRSLGLLSKMAIPVTLVALGVENWPTIKKYLTDPIQLKLIWKDPPAWVTWLIERAADLSKLVQSAASPEGQKAAKDAWDSDTHDSLRQFMNAQPGLYADQEIRKAYPDTNPWYKPSNSYAQVADEEGRERARGGQRGDGSFNFAEQRAQTMTVNFTAPQNVRVDVAISGTVNGPVNGSGSANIPISATADRGQALTGQSSHQ